MQKTCAMPFNNPAMFHAKAEKMAKFLSSNNRFHIKKYVLDFCMHLSTIFADHISLITLVLKISHLIVYT